MKNYYELLGVAPAAAADEIKRAFRREIARYHPDKVQHLGEEFQAIAAARAAELTEAYRVLMDQAARTGYDQMVQDGAAGPKTPVPKAPAPKTPPPRRPETKVPDVPKAPSRPPEGQPDAPLPDRQFQKDRASTSSFVKRAAGSLLLKSVELAGGRAMPKPFAGFDAVFDIKSKGGLFKKSEPAVRLLARFVPHVDAAAVQESWPLAMKAAPGKDVVLCLLLLGAGIAPANELSTAVAQLRRTTRAAGPVLVPVDVRDWEALFPPESPASVRAILQTLREGKL